MRATNRQTQLRDAKSRQRKREKAAGLANYQMRLPRQLAEKLRFGMHNPEFVEVLHHVIEEEVIRVGDYPNLLLICWNRKGDFITAADAFSLYERNWRFVDETGLCLQEKELISRLKDRYGGGLINA